MFNLLELLNDQVTEFQWSNKVVIMMILKDVLDANTDYLNLLTNHGEINLNKITKFEETYVRKESRAAHDATMLYHCLMNSVSKVGKAKVSVWNSQYKVNRPPSGNLFLKLIIRKSHLYTTATMA